MEKYIERKKVFYLYTFYLAWVLIVAFVSRDLYYVIITVLIFFIGSLIFIVKNSMLLSKSASKTISLRRENRELKKQIMELSVKFQKEHKEKATQNQKCLLFLIAKKLYADKKFIYKKQLYGEIKDDLEKLGSPYRIGSMHYIYNLCDEYIDLKDEKK